MTQQAERHLNNAESRVTIQPMAAAMHRFRLSLPHSQDPVKTISGVNVQDKCRMGWKAGRDSVTQRRRPCD